MAHRIMIVEDVATTRTLLRKILTNGGYDVVEAESGEAAIRNYRTESPDVVIMDVFMADLSGVGAMQVMMRLDPNARVVICTSDADLAFIAEIKRMGARGYLRKPFAPEAVHKAIDEALA